MRRKFAIGIIVVSILLGLVVWIGNAKAVMLIMDESSGNTVKRDCVCNIQPLDDFWPNLTMPTFRFKHRYPIDYSSGSLSDCGCSDIVNLKGNRILLLVIAREKTIFIDMFP